MAKFDKHGRPIPVRPDLPGPRGPTRPSLVYRRDEQPSDRPNTGDKRENFMGRLSAWKAQMEGITGTGEPKAKKVNLFSALFVGLFFMGQLAFLLLSGNDDPEPGAIEGPPIVRMDMSGHSRPDATIPTTVEASQLGSLQRSDPEVLEAVLQRDVILVQGLVVETEFDGENSDRVSLAAGTGIPLQLDVDADADPSLRTLDVGSRHRFACSRGNIFQSEILLFACRDAGNPAAIVTTGVAPPPIVRRSVAPPR